MNSYAVQEASGTSVGNITVLPSNLGVPLPNRLGLMGVPLATQLVAAGSSVIPCNELFYPPHVRIEAFSKTYGQYTNLFTGEYERSSLNFEQAVASFYEKLLATQEPLGKEFEEVLYDNLWELLVRT